MESTPRGAAGGPTDADLVAQAKAGASAAFGLLVRRYQGLAMARAYALVGERTEAEDVAQEAFLRAYRHIGQLRRPEAFAAWLLQTVSNVARRAASRRARRAAAPLDADVRVDPPPHDDVLEAIATLPEGLQQVIHLHYGEGYSCAEIAHLLGLQVGSVTSRLTRARQRLRKAIEEDS